MHLTPKEGYRVAKEIREGAQKIETPYELVLCPPFTSLFSVKEALEGEEVLLGAQNTHWEEKGAFTGEISIPMLEEIGVRYVIVGHSERRKYFCETDSTVNLKLRATLSSSITPIFCIGETLEERQGGEARTVVKRQMLEGLKGIETDQIRKIVIAYEPVWAIGTGESASPKDIEEMHSFIREFLDELGMKNLGEETTILYGGSVKPDNAKEITQLYDVDGALIGGASLRPESYLAIVERAYPKNL